MSKTVITSWVAILSGILGSLGVDFPVDKIQAISQAAFGDPMEGYLVIFGVIMLFLRKYTSGPVAGGIKGLLGARK